MKFRDKLIVFLSTIAVALIGHDKAYLAWFVSAMLICSIAVFDYEGIWKGVSKAIYTGIVVGCVIAAVKLGSYIMHIQASWYMIGTATTALLYVIVLCDSVPEKVAK